jgi:hypothetical protein
MTQHLDLESLAARSPEHAAIIHQLGDRFIQVVVDALAAELERLDEASPR